MPEPVFLCYITDRAAFGGDERSQRLHLLEKIAEAAKQGVDYIQLREKDLSGRELESLAREAIRIIREHAGFKTGNRPGTALLINSRTDAALATEADGVHLRGGDVSVGDVRTAWTRAARGRTAGATNANPIISVSCHSAEEVAQAAGNGASVALFAPVFEKEGGRPSGIDGLGQACQAKIPVLALGGVTVENADSCLRVGAAGVAGIRLFQENDMEMVVNTLRSR
jgi:thiamine-phosphate pyrophosphorylase